MIAIVIAMRSLEIAALAALAACGSTPPSADASTVPADAAYAFVSPIFATATSISLAEIDLTLTAGPGYSIERGDTGQLTTYYALGALAFGATLYRDYGEDGSPDINTGGGLRASWQYTYRITILDGSEAPDPRFVPIVLSGVQTYVLATTPPPDSVATVTGSASAM
jgi:hypothetical protein